MTRLAVPAMLALALALGLVSPAAGQTTGWPVYGGDAGNTRYSSARQDHAGERRQAQGRVGAAARLPALPGVHAPRGGRHAVRHLLPRAQARLRGRRPDGQREAGATRPRCRPGSTSSRCCDVNNRGVAYANGKVFVGRLDGHLVALDATNGKELWKTPVVDYTQGSVITSPPTIVKNLVITGFGGGEYGARGYISAMEQDTGKEVWRLWTIPGAGEPGSDSWKGDSWKLGGGVAWGIGSYDPKLNLLYYGTSNPSPWGASVRGPDSSEYGKFTNLYSSTTLAINPDTGKLVWYYQSTPHDAWDYDGVNELVLTDLSIAGQMTPVALKADRNGFFYVLNRADGQAALREAVRADQLGDRRRPQHGTTDRGPRQAAQVQAAGEGHLPQPARRQELAADELQSRRPASSTSRRSTSAWTWKAPSPPTSAASSTSRSSSTSARAAPAATWAELMAWDPVKQEKVWGNKDELPWLGGALTTKGGLAFHGDIKGWFKALDAKTGKTLWQFNTGSGISAAPITYELDGKQYVAVVSGRTFTIPLFLGPIGAKMVAASPEGGTLFVFELPTQ